MLEVVEKTDSLAWKLDYEQDEQAQQKLMSTSYHASSSQTFKPVLGATTSSPGKQLTRSAYQSGGPL